MLKPLCTCQHNTSTLSFLFKTGIWPSSACYFTYWLLHIKEVTQMCCHHCSLIARKYRVIVHFCCNIARNHCRYCCGVGVAQSKWTKPNPSNRQISITFSGVVAGGPHGWECRGWAGAEGPQQAGDRGRGRHWRCWWPPLPLHTVPTDFTPHLIWAWGSGYCKLFGFAGSHH